MSQKRCEFKLNTSSTDQSSADEVEVTVDFCGKYSLLVTNEILQSIWDESNVYVSWNSDKKKEKKNNESYCLDWELVRMILTKLENLNVNDLSQGYLIEGYMRAITKTHDGNKIILHAHQCFHRKKWYNLAYVHFEEVNAAGMFVENYYLERITNTRICNNKWDHRSSNSLFKETIKLDQSGRKF
jgi:hypothetical protein